MGAETVSSIGVIKNFILTTLFLALFGWGSIFFIGKSGQILLPLLFGSKTELEIDSTLVTFPNRRDRQFMHLIEVKYKSRKPKAFEGQSLVVLAPPLTKSLGSGVVYQVSVIFPGIIQYWLCFALDRLVFVASFLRSLFCPRWDHDCRALPL